MPLVFEKEYFGSLHRPSEFGGQNDGAKVSVNFKLDFWSH